MGYEKEAYLYLLFHYTGKNAANNCITFLMNSSIEVNMVDPDQTAPIKAV